MPMFKRIDHIEIVTDKLEKSVQLYRRSRLHEVGASDRMSARAARR